MNITKTDYILYRECAKDAWLRIHKPEIYNAHEPSDFVKNIIQTGSDVEEEARKLFPNGVLVPDRYKKGQNETQNLLEQKSPVIFQAVFEKDGFLAALDVLEYDTATGSYIVTEIKATNELKDKKHLPDLAFQVNLLKKCGLTVSAIRLIHLNREYVRRGELNLRELFITLDVTEEVGKILADVDLDMQKALSYLSSQNEPEGSCTCIYKGRSSHCTTFPYSNPKYIDYGIHDLFKIGLSKKKLTDLVDSGFYTLDDIPTDFDLTERQRNQVDVHIAKRPMISTALVAQELDKLTFPLYFLDYETYPAGIPRFDGYWPYAQIPFQYSLHILKSPDAELVHKEFLYLGSGDPGEEIAASMRENIGDVGSVIVWYKEFETKRNEELAKRLPAYKAFYEDLNQRVYDLIDPFDLQYYVDPNFKGKTSIKYVLPALVPELSYKELDIREGGTASERWNRVATGQAQGAEAEKIGADLQEYCKLDTYAMYAIWRHLHNLISPNLS